MPRELAVRDAVRRPIESDAAAPEYGEVIADAADFPELMADEDDAVPIAAKAIDCRKELRGFRRRKHRRRLIEDQHLHVAIERLENLHPLLLSHG